MNADTTNNALAVLDSKAIDNRVATTNRFSKAEIVAYRDAIRLARAAKREKLSKLSGANVGSELDEIMQSHGAVVTEMRQWSTARLQKWTVVLTAKKAGSEVDRLKAQAARLQKRLNEVENKLADAGAIPV